MEKKGKEEKKTYKLTGRKMSEKECKEVEDSFKQMDDAINNLYGRKANNGKR